MREDFRVYSSHYRSLYRNSFGAAFADEQERHDALMHVSTINNPTERDVKLKEWASRAKSPVARQEMIEARRYSIIANNIELYMNDELNDPILVIAKARHELKAYFATCEPGSYDAGIVDSSTRDIEAALYFRERNAAHHTSTGEYKLILPDLSIYDEAYSEARVAEETQQIIKDPVAHANYLKMVEIHIINMHMI